MLDALALFFLELLLSIFQNLISSLPIYRPHYKKCYSNDNMTLIFNTTLVSFSCLAYGCNLNYLLVGERVAWIKHSGVSLLAVPREYVVLSVKLGPATCKTCDLINYSTGYLALKFKFVSSRYQFIQFILKSSVQILFLSF